MLVGPASGEVERLALGQGAGAAARCAAFEYSPERERLYAAMESGALLEADLTNGQVVLLSVGSDADVAESVACAAGRLYVGLGSGELLTVDLISRELLPRTWLGDVAVRKLVAAPGHQRVFTALSQGDQHMCELVGIDTASGDVAHRSELGKGVVRELFYLPEQQRLIAVLDTSLGTMELVAFDPASAEVVRRLRFGDARLESSLSYVPEQARLYGGLGNSKIVALNLASWKVATVACPGGAGVRCLTYVAEQKQLYAGLGNGELVVVDASTGEVRETLQAVPGRVSPLLEYT